VRADAASGRRCRLRAGPLRGERMTTLAKTYFGWKNETGVISWLFCDSRYPASALRLV
jgi:hypothetical protein